MAIDVTVFIDNLIKNNPNIAPSTQQLQSKSQASALFNSLQSGGLNASQLLNIDKLPAGVKANVSAFVNGTGSLQPGNIPNVPGLPSVSGLTGPAAGQQLTKKNTNTGIDNAFKESFALGANRALLAEPDTPKGIPLNKQQDAIPVLLQNEVRAIMIQIAFMETNNTIDFNESGRYGRYAIADQTLQIYGYKDKSGNWTEKDGIFTKEDFLFDHNVQDRILEFFIKDQYQTMIKVGAIKPYDTKETVAGMIAVAYQFQDATPSISNLSGLTQNFDVSSLIGSSQDLISSLSSINSASQTALGKSMSVLESNQVLTSAGTNFASTLQNSSVTTDLQSVANKLMPAVKAGDAVAAKGLADVSGIQQQFQNLANSNQNTLQSLKTELPGLADSTKSQLSSTLTGMQDQAKLVTSKVDVGKFYSSAVGFAASLAATKAKSWRELGIEIDTKGRPGSLFFNAGRYAVKTLAADITQQG